MKHNLLCITAFVAALGGIAIVGLGVIGQPIAFRLAAFAGFGTALLLIANIGDILDDFATAQERARRSGAQLTGDALPLEQPMEERGRRALVDLIRIVSVITGFVALAFALTGIPAIPGGSLLALVLVLTPVILMTGLAAGAFFATRDANWVADKVAAAERLHVSVRALADKLTAVAGDEAEGGMALVATIVVHAAQTVASHPDAERFQITLAGITDNPDDAHFGLQSWVNDVIAVLDLQPIERAQAWVDQLTAASADFARAATVGGDLSFELIVDPE